MLSTTLLPLGNGSTENMVLVSHMLATMDPRIELCVLPAQARLIGLNRRSGLTK